MSDELHAAYQREARLANTIGLSVPVSLAVQQLDELRKISSLLEKLLAVAAHPPLRIEDLRIGAPTATTKKDSRP